MPAPRHTLWRCQNAGCSNDPSGRLIFDFEAELPICPKCGADARRPEFRQTVIRRECIHLHVPTPNGPDIPPSSSVRYGLACHPTKSALVGGRATSEAICVTCPACMKTQEYRDGMESFGIYLEDADFVIEKADAREGILTGATSKGKDGVP